MEDKKIKSLIMKEESVNKITSKILEKRTSYVAGDPVVCLTDEYNCKGEVGEIVDVDENDIGTVKLKNGRTLSNVDVNHFDLL